MHDGWLLLFLGVRTCQDETFNLKQYLHTNLDCKINNVICLVAGSRPVKDPLYLVKEFAGMLKRKNLYFTLVMLVCMPGSGGGAFNSKMAEIVPRLLICKNGETIQRYHSQFANSMMVLYRS